MTDVTNPSHYTRLDPEPIVVIERWGLGFCLGNALKYLARAGFKPGAEAHEDLSKARWYIDRAIAGAAQELEDLADTCALDVADRGPVTLEAAGLLINVTRERLRQIEQRALNAVRGPAIERGIDASLLDGFEHTHPEAA